ncbi:MAG: alginate export family protein [Gammaproteobacteria bacterium]|nr:alginate export family protein [Gammaproteobacteria bacterium]MDH3506996.1 alginate export family protein [Gammaproteobacteria bacterium]
MTAVNGQESQFMQALRDGSVGLAFRYRYELVDQDSIAANANASTLRTRLSYTSEAFRDFSLFLEMDDLRPAGSDSFNSTRNGKTTRPVVADPKGTDLNQALIRYSGFADTGLVLGRQRINHANQRFIGGVGWRQNEQTYDALEITHAFSESLEARYTYVSNVNRIFGPSSGVPAADLGSSSHFLDANYDLPASANLMGYAYLLDFDNAAAASNQTLGLRLTGTLDLSERFTMPYVAEYARQGDYADNPTDYEADYLFLEAGLAGSDYSVKLGYEVLEGDGTPGRAFTTPLATLHAFQGWADMFLATPANGIEDFQVTVTGRVGRVNLTAVYHDFSADTGGGSYGDELDLSAGWAFADNYSVLLKMASYSADGFATDTLRFWAMLSASF